MASNDKRVVSALVSRACRGRFFALLAAVSAIAVIAVSRREIVGIYYFSRLQFDRGYLAELLPEGDERRPQKAIAAPRPLGYAEVEGKRMIESTVKRRALSRAFLERGFLHIRRRRNPPPQNPLFPAEIFYGLQV